MERKLHVGIAGTGMMGRLQADALRRLPGVEIEAVCSGSPERARAFAAAQGIPNFYGDYEEMLNACRLDAVHICTPNYTHFAYSRAALERGIPVYCEKPLTAGGDEARELCRLAKEKGVPAGVN